MSKLHQQAKQEKKSVFDPFIMLSFLGVLVFYLLPLFDSFRYTFTEGVAEQKFVGFANFKDLLTNSAFQLAVKNTFSFMLLGVPILMVLALLVSFFLLEGEYKAVRFFLLVPLIIPSSAYLPGIIEIFKRNGMLNRMLGLLGFSPVDYLTDHAMGVLIFVYVLKNIGYLTVVLSGSMEGILTEYKEVWQLEKKVGIHYLIKIVIPLILPTVLFALLLSVMGCLKIFREAYLLYGESPPMSVYLLQYFMNNNFYKLNFQRLSGAAFLVILVLLLFIILFLWLQNRVKQE